MKGKAILLLVGLLFLGVYTGFAQDITVKGTVTDAQTGEPIVGVNVLVVGTNRGTATDDEGHYSLTVPSLHDTLRFSYIGYQTRTVPISGRTAVDIQMESTTIMGQQLIVTGYQQVRETQTTGAISVVDTDDIKSATVSNPMKALQGHIPGVFVQTSGDPSGGATVRIRGINSLNSGEPLYVVDGVPVSGEVAKFLSASAIKSIQVLKDAAAASIYGSRASNGVIVITTKDGSSDNKLHVTYSAKLTRQYYLTKPNMLGTKQRARVMWRAAINDGIDPGSLPIYSYKWHRNSQGRAILDKVIIPKKIAPGMPSANVDYFDATSGPGFIQQHNLTLSTGGENWGGFFGLKYFGNNYIYKYQNYKSFSGRVNTHYSFANGKITIGENLTVSKGIDSGYDGTVFSLNMQFQSIIPIRTVGDSASGEWGGPPGAGFIDRQNPVRVLVQNRDDQRLVVNATGNVYVNVSLAENLQWNNTFGFYWRRERSRNIARTFQSGFLSRDISTLAIAANNESEWTVNSTLEYKIQLNKNSFTILGGVEANRHNFRTVSAFREDFALNDVSYFVLDAGTGSQSVSGDRSDFSLLSFFGKIDYSFNDKYLVSATVRYDGSSRFGKNYRFGFFPAFSVGWRLAQEAFISNNLPFISALKLRASFGITGNQRIPPSAIFTLYKPFYGEENISFNINNDATSYDLGGQDSGTLPSGYVKVQTGNPNLKWEQTRGINIGLDFGFFEQKITGSVNFFKKHTTDILIQPPYLAVIGNGGDRFVNGATMDTKGFEASISYTSHADLLNFTITGNIGHYKNKIVELPGRVEHAYPGNSEKTILGNSLNSLFGYVVQGIFESKQEVQNSVEQPGKAIGRLRYKDLNGDGEINSLDQKYLGVQAPLYTFGLQLHTNIKNFYLNIFFRGVAGREVNNAYKVWTDFTSMRSAANFGVRTLNAWTPYNTDTLIPAVTLSDTNNEDRMSSYFVSEGSYLKLQEVRLGYTFNNLNNFNLKKISIYLTGSNLLTFKDNHGKDAYIGPDPEISSYGFPRPLKVTLGVRVSL